MASSLLRRRYLIPVSKVCEAAPISLFWLPSGLNELPEMRVEFPFNLVGKFTIAFYKLANHGAYLNSGTYRWGPRTTPERESRRCFADGLYQNGLDSSVTQAVWLPVLSVKS